MRLFIAVNFPDTLRQGVWEATATLRAADFPVKWVEPEGVHLTLKFLGEVAPERRDAIVSALRGAAEGTRRFVLAVSGFGAFPSPERPRVIWVGCERLPALELLQHRVEQALERLGFPLEGRAFRPHLTLGRVKQGARPPSFNRLESLLEGLDYVGESEVGSVDLMESRLGPHGARYEVADSVAFGA
ncbi:MAG: RNA 2',3'-cyclic phosphodiesterase [Gemmatimonadetes bacterium]|nr:RNA 2',3'-cyclic phosphodiesterase [Gemmatimonadota bacterium]